MTQRWIAMTLVMAGVVGTGMMLGPGVSPAAAAEPALAGQWRFDEGAGQAAVDDGPYRLDGRLGFGGGVEAADPVRISGASGGALRFGGAALVSLPDTDRLAMQSLTAEAVVRAPVDPGQWRYLVSRGSRGCYAGAYGLYTGAAGGVAMYVFDGVRYVVSATARPADIWDGAWHHVAGTFDGTALRLYLDGRPVGTPMSAPSSIDYAGTSAHSVIGGYAGGCELGFAGDMDLVRLWSGALAPAAVTAAAQGASVATGSAGTLPAAATGTVIPAGRQTSAPSKSACVVRLLHTSTSKGRRSVVRVRVRVGHRALRGARVVARRTHGSRLLARTRTNARGRARLVMTAPRSRRVRISAPGRWKCASVRVRLRK